MTLKSPDAEFRLMLDFDASPLWQKDAAGDWVDLRPESLGLPAALCERLWALAKRYQETFCETDAILSGFPQQSQRRELYDIAVRLTTEVEQCLAKKVELEMPFELSHDECHT